MSLETGRVPCHPDFVMYMSGTEYMPRAAASAIIEYVGVNSPAGMYPCEIPPHILGRAVRRLVFNFFTNGERDEQNPSEISREFLAGFLKLAIVE